MKPITIQASCLCMTDGTLDIEIHATQNKSLVL